MAAAKIERKTETASIEIHHPHLNMLTRQLACVYMFACGGVAMSDSVTLAVRLEASLVTMLESLARREGLEATAYVQRLLRLHLAQSGLMAADERDRVLLIESLISRAIAKAVQLDHEGSFDAHFTLTVIDALFADPTFLADYERVVGGSAFSRGLAAKASLNMNLGWQIKSAVRADPLLDEKGKARRVQIKGRPIQSYTLLTRAGSSSRSL